MTALAHELAGLIGPLHGLVSEFQSPAEKNRATPDLKRANADPAATADSTKRRAEKINAALTRRCKAGLMPRRREQVNRGCCGNLLHPVRAIVTPRIEAVLHFALMIDGVESPVTKRRNDHDGDDRGDVAAPARLRLIVLLARRGSAHAERLEARCSTSPSAAIALATMPFASSPAAAYMRSGLS